ncbi:MAG TPA: hypothetical protein VIE67_13220 [Rudaea sp.]|jgi:hypothetical protein|uniref:hypothetical protein n=1 Tax=Rudaea sp. TaxID=2136325 RepID=UPI002F953E08
MNIHLHIDRLIVDGLPLTPPQARALRASVETQLGALFAAAPPRVASGHAAPALPVAPISWNVAAGVNAAGGAIAHSLHAALVPGSSPKRSSR